MSVRNTLSRWKRAIFGVPVLLHLVAAPVYSQATESSAQSATEPTPEAGDESQAGDEQAKPAEVADEIVVYSELYGGGLTRAGSVLSAREIERRPAGAEVTQSLAKVPGVQVSTGDARGGSFSYEIYLRGLSDEQIGFSVDGIPTGDSRFNGGQPPNRFLESSNIHKISVSQSSGDIGSPSRFALGGFVDFETDDPSSTPALELESGFGEFGFWRLFSRADFGKSENGWSGYLSASKQFNEIFTGPENRSSDRRHFELKLMKEAKASVIRFRASYNERDDNDFNIVSLDEFRSDPDSDQATDALSGIPNIDADFGGALGGTREDLLVYLDTDFRVGDRLLVEIKPYLHTLRGESFRYQNRQRDLEGDDPRAVLGYGPTGGAIRPDVIVRRDGGAVGGPADLRLTPRDRDRWGLTAEALYQGSEALGNLRFGLWYEDNEATEFRNFHPLLEPTRSLAIDRDDLRYVEYERTARVATTMLYAQEQWTLLDDRLALDIGVTYHDIDYRARSPLEYQATIDDSQDSGVNPKVGLAYDVTGKTEIFAGYAQNFAGIPEDAFLGSTAAIDIDDLAPLETASIDLGLRSAGRKWALLLQGELVTLENAIGIIPRDPSDPDDIDDILRGNVATKAGNIGGTETLGIEFSSYVDFGMLDVYSAYSWQDATHEEPDSEEARLNLAAQGILGGERIRDIPEHSAYVEIGIEPMDNLRFQASVKYTGERVGGHLIVPDFCNRFFCFDEQGRGVDALDGLGVETLDDFVVVGLDIRYTIGSGSSLEGLSLQLNIDNLLDEDYVSAVSGATASLPEFGVIGGVGRTLDRYFIGSPRTATVSAKYTF